MYIHILLCYECTVLYIIRKRREDIENNSYIQLMHVPVFTSA